MSTALSGGLNLRHTSLSNRGRVVPPWRSLGELCVRKWYLNIVSLIACTQTKKPLAHVFNRSIQWGLPELSSITDMKATSSMATLQSVCHLKVPEWCWHLDFFKQDLTFTLPFEHKGYHKLSLVLCVPWMTANQSKNVMKKVVHIPVGAWNNEMDTLFL